MRADDLVVLLEIARCGSLTGAASALGFNHATISRRMSALEDELRAPLLVRGVQGCGLTEFGQRLLASCERIESALSEVKELVAETPRDRALSGLVRISTTEAFGAHFIAPLMADLHVLHPELTVEIITQTRLSAYGVGADLEIGVGDPVASRPGADKLTDYRLGLYASHAYGDAHGLPNSRADLSGHSLIYYIESLLRVEDLDVLSDLASIRNVSFGSTSVQAQTVATVRGAGIGLLPAFIAEQEPTLQRVLPSEVSVVLNFSVCSASRRLLRPAAKIVLKAIREAVADRRSELLPDWPDSKGYASKLVISDAQ